MGDTGARGDPGDSVELPNNLVGDKGYKGFPGELGKFLLEFSCIYRFLDVVCFAKHFSSVGERPGIVQFYIL